MFGELETGDQRLHEAYGLLECKNTKRAIFEVNKLLKKNPKSPSANALKALILLRMAKLSEAYELVNSVMTGTPVDRDTLHFLSVFFRELDKEESMESYLKGALEKFPENEDLNLCLFFVYVRTSNFNAQQATARKLCQINNTERGYKFWMALSTVLQGEKDADLASRMFLPLAEKIFEKALNDGHFTSHDDFSVYLSVLLRLKKYSEVLKLLSDKTLIGLINTLDYDHDYSSELLKVNSELGNWAETLRISIEILDKDPDNWLAWQILLRHCFENEERRKVVLDLVELHLKKSPKCRGPRLAMIDYSANLIKRDIYHPKADESFCVELIKDYFKNLSRKPVGALDLAYVFPLLIKSDAVRVSLVNSLLKEAQASQNNSSLSPDDKVHSEVCAYRLARTNGVQINLADLIFAYKSRVKEPIPSEKDVTKEIMAYDGLLQLAVSELLDPVVNPSDTAISLGRILLGAYWLSEIGLKLSPANHFMRMKLMALLSPCGGLACVGRLLQELKSLNLKEVLFISIGHVAITPGPFLTIFGSRTLTVSSIPDHQDASLFGFYEGTIKRVWCIQRETENFLVRSYRRNAFGRIHENTQFLINLTRTDALILAQIELLYNKALIKSDCFDSVLEQIGQCTVEIASIRQALTDVCDNRDFSVVPEFYHRIPTVDNRQQSFDHLRAWMHLRVNLLNLIGLCSKLVMKAVPSIDTIGSGEISEISLKELGDIVNKIDAQQDSLVPQLNGNNIVHAFESPKFKYTDLLLPPELVCVTPPPLPPTNMTSFYLFGPFCQTLAIGTDLLKFLTGIMCGKLDDGLDSEKCPSILGLTGPLLQFVEKSRGIPFLPSPPQETSALSDSFNPSAVLVGLGVALESLSLAVFFATSAVAMLRPRIRLRQPSNRLKKNRKKYQHQCLDKDVEVKNLASPIGKRLDHIAVAVRTVLIPQIQSVAEKLQELSQEWAEWSSAKAAKLLTATAVQAAESAIPRTIETDESLSWFPTCSNVAYPPIFESIAADLTCGFAELVDAFGRKNLALKNSLLEIECFAGLKIDDCEK